MRGLTPLSPIGCNCCVDGTLGRLNFSASLCLTTALEVGSFGFRLRGRGATRPSGLGVKAGFDCAAVALVVLAIGRFSSLLALEALDEENFLWWKPIGFWIRGVMARHRAGLVDAALENALQAPLQVASPVHGASMIAPKQASVKK